MISKGFKKSILNKVLAYTLYNPKIEIDLVWTQLRSYSVQELKEYIGTCIDADDDTLTQFIEPNQLKTELHACSSFEDIIEVFSWRVYYPENVHRR